MNIILTLILIFVILGSDWYMFKKLREMIPSEKPAEAPKKAEQTDNHASNAEQRYMEGIENVLNYDVDTMRKHLRGEDEA